MGVRGSAQQRARVARATGLVREGGEGVATKRRRGSHKAGQRERETGAVVQRRRGRAGDLTCSAR